MERTFRALLAACRAFWFVQRMDRQGKQPTDLLKGRPWYRKKEHPTQADVQWMFKETLTCEGIKPTPAFVEGMPIINMNRIANKKQAA